MNKRILPLLLLVVIFLWTICPLRTFAATPLDPDAQASLTLHYQKEGIAFADLQIEIYRVAQAFADGSFKLIEPFVFYPISIHGVTSQQQWNYVAQTLNAYIVANGVAPDREAKTDANGTICFSDLKTGLYFIREVIADNASGTYVFNQFMIYVPTPQPDGSYEYEVEAKPKCTSFAPKSQYSVTKLWQDGGNQNYRPKEVTVEIYKDGVLYDTQLLNADNNWTYTWSVSGEDQGQWTVVERTAPEGYTVTIQQNGGVFSIVNTHQTVIQPPQTGDSFSPLLWVFLMCFVGIALVILGVYSRRQQ